MIIETTFIGDDGKPFIMDGATYVLVVEDKKTGDQLRFDGDITGNKSVHYIEMPKEAKKGMSDAAFKVHFDKWKARK